MVHLSINSGHDTLHYLGSPNWHPGPYPSTSRIYVTPDNSTTAEPARTLRYNPTTIYHQVKAVTYPHIIQTEIVTGDGFFVEWTLRNAAPEPKTIYLTLGLDCKGSKYPDAVGARRYTLPPSTDLTLGANFVVDPSAPSGRCYLDYMWSTDTRDFKEGWRATPVPNRPLHARIAIDIDLTKPSPPGDDLFICNARLIEPGTQDAITYLTYPSLHISFAICGWWETPPPADLVHAVDYQAAAYRTNTWVDGESVLASYTTTMSGTPYHDELVQAPGLHWVITEEFDQCGSATVLGSVTPSSIEIQIGISTNKGPVHLRHVISYVHMSTMTFPFLILPSPAATLEDYYKYCGYNWLERGALGTLVPIAQLAVFGQHTAVATWDQLTALGQELQQCATTYDQSDLLHDLLRTLIPGVSSKPSITFRAGLIQAYLEKSGSIFHDGYAVVGFSDLSDDHLSHFDHRIVTITGYDDEDPCGRAGKMAGDTLLLFLAIEDVAGALTCMEAPDCYIEDQLPYIALSFAVPGRLSEPAPRVGQSRSPEKAGSVDKRGTVVKVEPKDLPLAVWDRQINQSLKGVDVADSLHATLMTIGKTPETRALLIKMRGVPQRLKDAKSQTVANFIVAEVVAETAVFKRAYEHAGVVPKVDPPNLNPPKQLANKSMDMLLDSPRRKVGLESHSGARVYGKEVAEYKLDLAANNQWSGLQVNYHFAKRPTRAEVKGIEDNWAVWETALAERSASGKKRVEVEMYTFDRETQSFTLIGRSGGDLLSP